MRKDELIEYIEGLDADLSYVLAIEVSALPNSIATGVKVLKSGPKADAILDALPLNKNNEDEEGLTLKRVKTDEGWSIAAYPFPNAEKGAKAFISILQNGEIFKMLSKFVPDDAIIFLSKGAHENCVVFIGHEEDHIEIFTKILQEREIAEIIFKASQNLNHES